MTGEALFFWAANLVCDTFGQLLLKAGSRSAEGTAGLAHWLRLARSFCVWLGLACFALEFVFWLSLLAVVPLAMALFVGSANIVCVMLGARLWFGERITPQRGAAITLIAAGVALVGWGHL